MSRSIADFHDAVRRYLREHNRAPKPFVGTKPANLIFTKVANCRACAFC